MAYEDTEVAVSKSQDQIRQMVYAHRGTGLMLISKPPQEGFEAFITIEQTAYHIRVIATCKDVSRDRYGLLRTGNILVNASRTKEERRVWRVLFYHLKAMFEAADSGVVDLRNVVMPYVVLRDGRTLGDHIQPKMPELMTMNPERLLGGSNG